MNLVLLPGMDGSGTLFGPFVDALGESHDNLIIPLPTGREQSYEFLAQYVRERLPCRRGLVLLAESFSGPIAYRLLQDGEPNIESVIFVASFVRRPISLAWWGLRLVSGPMLRRHLISNFAFKMCFVGFGFNEILLKRCWDAIGVAGIRTIKSRLEAVLSLKEPQQRIRQTCFYIQPQNDRIVSRREYDPFARLFDDLRLYRIGGPHMILQAKPRECAAIVNDILEDMRWKTDLDLS
ncbi:MAG: hypothetical protein AB1483_08265 [Candidatus Zixiibacteriota bacterium]